MMKEAVKPRTSLVSDFGTFDEIEVQAPDPNVASVASAEREPAAVRESAPTAPKPADVAPIAPAVPEPARVHLAGFPEPSPVGLAELRSFPSALVTKMGAVSLLVRVDNVDVCFTTSRIGFARAKTQGLPVFVGGEFIALAHAAQNGQVSSFELVAFAAKKKRSPDWRLTPSIAFDCRVHNCLLLREAKPLSCCLGDVLHIIGAELVAYEGHS